MEKLKVMVLLLLMAGLTYKGNAQVISATDANGAIQNLLGEGIEIVSVSFTGEDEQLSLVSGAPSTLGFSDGVVITTNKRGYLQSGVPNESAGSYTISSGTSDYHLNQINGYADMHSRAYLTIAFKTSSSHISFDYVFASNEYPGYNCCQYNDAFGFFLMGPGIPDYENIAQIPGSNTPVTINTVNNGTPAPGCGNILNCSSVNTSYYNSSPWFYGGSTQVMNASWEVECQETYILKIAICNTKDPYFNSAVFIKSNSLKSEFNLGAVSADVQPICEGQDMTLTTTGPDGYIYQWTDENGNPINSGLDMKQITLPATASNTGYSVSITDPGGCTLTQSVTVAVHTEDNLPPWMDGINGTGEYTYYVSAGDLVSFTSTLYNDDPSEQIDISTVNNASPNLVFTPSPPSGGTCSFSWQTSPATPPGEYTFTLHTDDQNACIPLTGTFTFRIIVVCRYCPICINYEDRTPYNDPLPGETKVGNCIYAGLTDPVETGNADVLFQAGNEIVLGDFFSAGPGFIGEIDPSVCIDDCEECCEEWEGFTLDTPLPDIFTPNDDGLNDFWFVRDEDHPFCAFNAQGFSLLVFNRWGNVVHKLEDYGVGCCSYTAPSPSNPIPYSSIYWDGRDHITGELVTSEAYYFYSITLFGCGWDEHFSGSIYVNYTHQYNGLGLLEQNDAYLLPVQAELREPITMEEGEEENERVRQPSQSAITLSPNPATDRVTIHGLEEPEYDMVLLSGKGSKVLQKKVAPGDNQINISHLAPGTYFVLITTEDTVHFDKLVIN